jgi:hypothetical protein
MTEWLAHPLIQTAVAPFLVALLFAWPLRRLGGGSLALAAGLAVTVYLAIGFGLAPLTATRKIVIVGIAAFSVGLLLDVAHARGRGVVIMLAVAGAACALWVLWPVLKQKEMSQALLFGGIIAAYVAWLVAWSDGLSRDSIKAGSAGLGLGLGSGGAALLGTSALLGQFGLSLGASCGALLLARLLTRRGASVGRSFTLLMSLVAGLVAAAAVVLAKTPWYAPLLLAPVPLAVRLPIPETIPVWIRAGSLSLVAIAFSAACVALTWRAVGGL